MHKVLLLQTNYVTFAALPGNNDIIAFSPERQNPAARVYIKLARRRRRGSTHLRGFE